MLKKVASNFGSCQTTTFLSFLENSAHQTQVQVTEYTLPGDVAVFSPKNHRLLNYAARKKFRTVLVDPGAPAVAV